MTRRHLTSLNYVASVANAYSKSAVSALKHGVKVRLTEAIVRRCSVKKVFLEIFQNSQENTSARVSSLIKLQAAPMRTTRAMLINLCIVDTPRCQIFIWVRKVFCLLQQTFACEKVRGNIMKRHKTSALKHFSLPRYYKKWTA